MTIDIFCDVIDNFGDAGVCWRLASIFSCEHGFPVKLYINDAETLSKITAGLDPKNYRALSKAWKFTTGGTRKRASRPKLS